MTKIAKNKIKFPCAKFFQVGSKYNKAKKTQINRKTTLINHQKNLINITLNQQINAESKA